MGARRQSGPQAVGVGARSLVPHDRRQVRRVRGATLPGNLRVQRALTGRATDVTRYPTLRLDGRSRHLTQEFSSSPRLGERHMIMNRDVQSLTKGSHSHTDATQRDSLRAKC